MGKPSEAPTIAFYFDYISSNAYLAWRALPRIAERFGARLEPRPVLFAALLEAHGQLGPAEIPAKVHWMWKNNLRKAARLGVTLRPPSFHPFNPLLALRVSLLPIPQPARSVFIDGLFRAIWSEQAHGSDPTVVAAALEQAGLAAEPLLEQAQSAEVKALLRSETEAAIAAGVFGVPTMRVGDELFWGYDDLPQLELLLAGDDPLDPAEVEAWMRPPRASATRRRLRKEA